MIYLLVGGGVGCFALMLVFLVLVIGGLAYIGHHVPPTEIIAWGNIEKHHKEKVMKLGIIPPQENVLFVYSDELSFEEGCYILTDQSMIIHSAANDTETLKLTDVEFIEPYYGTAYEDGWVWLTLKNGENYGFPISGENGTDKKLVRRLQELSGAEFYVESDEDY